MNTYSQNALRRFANSVNTALTIPMPRSAKDALAETLDKLDQTRLAGDAACLLLDSTVVTQSESDKTENNPIQPSTQLLDSEQLVEMRNHEQPVAPKTPTFEAVFRETLNNVAQNDTKSSDITPLFDTVQAKVEDRSLTEIIAPLPLPIESPIPPKVDTIIHVVENTKTSSKRAISKIQAQQTSNATAFFQLLPWYGTSEVLSEDVVDQSNILAAAKFNDLNSLPATRFFQSLCWSTNNNSHFAISAGRGASGGTVAPEELLILQNQRMAIPIHQFFNQIPWAGNSPAQLQHL